MVDLDDVAFICLDLETTGLSPDTEWILEVGITLADKELHELASFESLVWPGDSGPLDNLDRVVRYMHQESGLLSELLEGGEEVPTTDVVESRALDWLKSFELPPGKFPLMGSTVHFDRAFLKVHMPDLESFFHYRNIDVSSIKEISKVWHPNDGWVGSKEKRHRALDDVSSTIEEASFYYEKFFNGYSEGQ